MSEVDIPMPTMEKLRLIMNAISIFLLRIKTYFFWRKKLISMPVPADITLAGTGFTPK